MLVCEAKAPLVWQQSKNKSALGPRAALLLVLQVIYRGQQEQVDGLAIACTALVGFHDPVALVSAGFVTLLSAASTHWLSRGPNKRDATVTRFSCHLYNGLPPKPSRLCCPLVSNLILSKTAQCMRKSGKDRISNCRMAATARPPSSIVCQLPGLGAPAHTKANLDAARSCLRLWNIFKVPQVACLKPHWHITCWPSKLHGCNRVSPSVGAYSSYFDSP